ncbi:hypothetical protein [Nocardia bovistercoris]|uniref:Uncharacterized protein n=1 Tax=Nocardia bovistercoris TaxID=2785916 RepID=A0A931IBM3_9NOCA|nr:hypothetical protein [Nocardia bovistercoris]MBH0776875.1 hypothetical protein [Nocardia bovistercoris]
MSAVPGNSGSTAGERSSGVTAICAGILAILGALGNLYSYALLWSIPEDSPEYAAMTTVPHDEAVGAVLFCTDIAVTSALLVGGILLLRRRVAGRALVTTGAALTVPLFVAAAVPAITSPTVPVTDLWVLLFPVITLVLAAAPETARWLGDGGAS